mgnify:CR=1 FL=1
MKRIIIVSIAVLIMIAVLLGMKVVKNQEQLEEQGNENEIIQENNQEEIEQVKETIENEVVENLQKNNEILKNTQVEENKNTSNEDTQENLSNDNKQDVKDDIESQPESEIFEEPEVEYISGYEVSGHIKIPKLNLDIPVFKYMNQYTLQISVGVAYGFLNEVGNTVIMGHAYEGYPFSYISQLEIGDVYTVTDSQKREITYEVYDKQVVSSQDASYFMRQTEGRREVVMQTANTQDTKLLIIAREKNT